MGPCGPRSGGPLSTGGLLSTDAHELEDWEIEHLQAIALADEAVEVSSAAEASCIEALQELLRPNDG